MIESHHNGRELSIDAVFLSRVLDCEIRPDAMLSPGVYDERRQICHDAQQAVDRLRSTLEARAAVVDMSPLEAAAQAVAWSPNALELRSLRHNLTRQRKWLGMIYGVADYLTDQVEEANSRGVPLRPHQQDVMVDFESFLIAAPRDENGGKSGIIEAPTGTGKTAIFANIVAALKYGERASEPIRVLVLVPNQTILEQTVGRKGERGFGKFAPHLDVGAYYQGSNAGSRRCYCRRSTYRRCRSDWRTSTPLL